VLWRCPSPASGRGVGHLGLRFARLRLA
jgi:hypothetical protein